MHVIRVLPLLVFVVVAYNVAAFSFGAAMTSAHFTVTLPSGAPMHMSVGDLMVGLGLVLLYVEIFKSTRTSTTSIVDHGLSLGLFVICLVEFIVVTRAGTSTFFLIMMMTLIDVVAGFTVTISTARHDAVLER